MVWEALGDVEHYVEPFAGSMAVLLNRPDDHRRTYYSETVNDVDGLLVNAYRAIQLYPDETAEHAAYPVSEVDLTARHLALVNWRAEHNLELLLGTPEWCDPKMAGWWLWGIACWIGSGWCSGVGPWIRGDDGRIEQRPRQKDAPGITRKLPHLTNNGQGVNHATLRASLGPEWAGGTLATEPLRRWMRALADRLRWVRILNGDWKRAVTTGATLTLPIRTGDGVCGVFLDPPYADSADRKGDLYAHDSLTIAHEVRAWALANGANPKYRIVVAGFDGEHGEAFAAAGWRTVEWFKAGFLRGGMGNLTGGGNHQQHRERLWLSPHCRAPETVAHPRQTDMFAMETQ